jgi:2,4-dienoyl-CoA reductase-like NADH-dependent reductase (Old Yellow Enzyme family)
MIVKKLFESVDLGAMRLKNRLIRSATQELMADASGRMTPGLLSLYRKLAEGGVGAIITGMVGVDENSRVAPTMWKAYDDAFAGDLREMADIVHGCDCRLIVQLAHCGVKARQIDSGDCPLGATAMTAIPDKPAKSMTAQEIKRVVDSFAAAALKSKQAGADGVQLHSAHGYLLSQFLSPYYNKRTDQYGGGIENRARIVLEAYDAVRQAVGADYPILIKINTEDKVDGGMTVDESAWVCGALEERGINAVELSAGIALSWKSSPMQRVPGTEDEGTFFSNTRIIADELRAPVISVGGWRTPDEIEKRLNDANIEAISLCRPLIREPDLVDRWRSGDRSKAQCVSCNKCFSPGKGYGCKAQTGANAS